MKKDTIYPGTDLKFRITVDKEDFSLHEDDFAVTVIRVNGRTRRIRKDDCFWDSEGRWYFTLENARPGTYWAWFRGSYEDDDYDKQRRVWTDCQVLTEIPGGRRPCCGRGHAVRYEQVWTVSIDGEDYLADSDGKYILTADGKRICFKSDKAKQIEDMGKVRLNMTGDEFKELVEGDNHDGVINTIPEQMRAMQGIGDDRTVKEEIDEEVSESDVERVSPDDLAGFVV